ncbi:MAG TPA: hypothetical protein VED63_12945 [Acidimicrobiales bacterium]|nr:hypothetical protein [Acidimicrobiales bacterium]
MLARVMTFYSDTARFADLVESLRSTLPVTYASVPGYEGLLVLEKPGGNHIIAASFWASEEGVKASEEIAADNAKRIGHAAGTTVSVNVYEVIGMDKLATT